MYCQNSIGEIRKLHFNDKSVSKVIGNESALNPVLDCFDTPTGCARIQFFSIMSKEKQFVAKDADMASATQKNFVSSYAYNALRGEKEKLEQLLEAVFNICSIDKNQKILKTLHHMYLSSVRNREALPDGMLDNITTLYECLMDFYELEGKEVGHE